MATRDVLVVLDHVTHPVRADRTDLPADTLVRVDADAFRDATGWYLNDNGLCRGDICVPVRDRSGLVVDGALDLDAFAVALRRPLLADAANGVAVIGAPAAGPLRPGDPAPDVTIADLDGNRIALSSLGGGTRRLLVAWSSWCGCRGDLPAWEAIAADLAAKGVGIVTVAVDEDPTAALPWTRDRGVTLPTGVDVDRALAAAYGLVNVPMGVVIDERDRIVRPPEVVFPDDTFTEVTGFRSGPFLELLGEWAATGEMPGVDAAAERDPDHDRARLHHEAALALHRARPDDPATAAAVRVHVDAARRLAPHDWTIRRGTMFLVGEDPFGAEFADLWNEAMGDGGIPGYPSSS